MQAVALLGGREQDLQGFGGVEIFDFVGGGGAEGVGFGGRPATGAAAFGVAAGDFKVAVDGADGEGFEDVVRVESEEGRVGSDGEGKDGDGGGGEAEGAAEGAGGVAEVRAEFVPGAEAEDGAAFFAVGFGVTEFEAGGARGGFRGEAAMDQVGNAGVAVELHLLAHFRFDAAAAEPVHFASLAARARAMASASRVQDCSSCCNCFRPAGVRV